MVLVVSNCNWLKTIFKEEEEKDKTFIISNSFKQFKETKENVLLLLNTDFYPHNILQALYLFVIVVIQSLVLKGESLYDVILNDDDMLMSLTQ